MSLHLPLPASVWKLFDSLFLTCLIVVNNGAPTYMFFLVKGVDQPTSEDGLQLSGHI